MEIKEPATPYGNRKFTIEEYPEMERASDQKHEYFEGKIFAMSGAGFKHNIIFSNLFGELGYKLQGHPCRPYGSDMRVHIPENTCLVIPISLSTAGIS